MNALTKTCCRCEAVKSLDEFYRSTVCKARPDGYYRNCKTCHKASVSESGRRRRALAAIAEKRMHGKAFRVAPARCARPLTSLGLKWCGTIGDQA